MKAMCGTLTAEQARLLSGPANNDHVRLILGGIKNWNENRPERGVNLSRVGLEGHDLSEGNFTGVDFGGARLCGTNFSDACLYNADFRGADLHNVNLSGATINFNSPELVSEILRQAAGDDIEKLKIAGLVLMCKQMDWTAFVKIDDPLMPWALKEIVRYHKATDALPALVVDAANLTEG